MFRQFGPSQNPLLKNMARVLASLSKRMGWLSVRYPVYTLEDRLAQFRAMQLELPAGTAIRFNGFFVPYVLSNSDRGAAYALGAITEFQRGPQLQFLKRLAQGRLSELGGRGFVDMDHLIRLLDFGKATPLIWSNMPEPSKQWVQGFVDGLNCVLLQRPRGVDEKLMGIEPEPYSALDVLLLGRLAGADVNWPIYFSLIEHRLSGEFIDWWNRLRRFGAGVSTSFDHPDHPAGQRSTAQQLGKVLAGLSRSGSNSFALSGQRTQSGYPMMANDPHLGQHLPNVWMMVGIRCPSYRCVGLMFPGVPVLGLGRNPSLAWGGTNLRAASSDLVRLDSDSHENTVEQTTRIKVRWGFTRKRRLRGSAHGPVLTDCKALGRLCGEGDLALRWAGHWPTDEITCFLNAMRATTVMQLRDAMAGVGVTPLNVLGADVDGNIGHVLAATLPKRDGFPHDDWVLPEVLASAQWGQRVCATDFPWALNPPQGYLVSANNRPAEVAGLGFLFNGDDRVMRARALMGAHRRLSAGDLLALQLDVTSPMADKLSSEMAQFCMPYLRHNAHQFLCKAIDQWDGTYSADSVEALQFEFLLAALVRQYANIAHATQPCSLTQQWSYLTACLLEDLRKLSPDTLAQVVPLCVDEAQRLAQRWQMWGNVHKIRLRHVLGHVPLLGKLFSWRSSPAPGSRETLMKNAHNLIEGFDETSYGSQSRHLSDLSDLDENHFVLLGGQDGWVGSMLMTDQVPLWQTQQSVQMPLRPERIPQLFPHLVGKLD